MVFTHLENDRSFLPPHVKVKAAPVNLTGQQFGKLTAIEVIDKHKSKSLLWRCRCDCGQMRDVPSSYLRSGKTKSCKDCADAYSIAQRDRYSRNTVWNKGKSYQIKKDDEVYVSKKAWTNAVLKRLGNKCQNCGWDEARCDVHHIVHKEHGGLNTISNARVLCPNCHRVHHAQH